MEFKDIFQQFLEYRDCLKVIFVASTDENGQPNCAPKIVADIVEPNEVYYLDFNLSYSYANLKKNSQISLSFMNDLDFTGFKFKGFGRVVDAGRDFETIKRKWLSRVTAHEKERLNGWFEGIPSANGSETLLPDDFIIVRFIAEEAALVKPDRTFRSVERGQTQPISRITNLQKRIAELEKTETSHLEVEHELASSRDLLQKTIDGITTPMMVIDRNYKIVLANQAVKKLAGDQECVAKGLTCYQVSHHNDAPCDGPTTQCPLRQVLSTHAPATVVHTHYNAEGKEIFVEVHATPVFGVDNDVVQMIESCQDITERRNLERMVLEIKQKEQQLIGQELHDGIAQHLTATALMVKVLEKKVVQDPSQARRGVRRVVRMVNQAISQTRDLAHGLYTLEIQSAHSKNIDSLLRKLAHDVEKTPGVHCAVQIDVKVHVADDEVAKHLYRIAREAVGNAVKHGQTKRILIQLNKKNAHESELLIENDGKKFLNPSKHEGLGLYLMRTRAAMVNAAFDIMPRPRGGTVVSCVFPDPS